MSIKRPKGTQDIMPGSVEKWQYLEDEIRKICADYGYQEIRTPIFEATELFERGVGETTDIVNKEMYTFFDKGKRSVTLRPEGTASVCRAYVENKMYAQPQPLKLYYLGPMFRYENTQAGRFRQFHQFGVEVLGGEDPLVDAEVIHLIWEFYRRIGIGNIRVHINSVGCPECRAEHRVKLLDYLKDKEEELCHDCQGRMNKNPLRILDCKNPTCQSKVEEAPTTLDTLCDDCANHFDKVKEFLSLTAIDYDINPKMVRGLDYYQKTAFEVMAEGIGAQSAICGGGRYDGLVEEIGGPSTPGIGFAMGIERILAVLENQNQFTEQLNKGVAVAALGDQAQKEGFKLSAQLRRAGIPTVMDLMGRGLKGQMKFADRHGSRYVLIIGEEELNNNIVIVRDMRLGEQNEIARDKIINYLIDNINNIELI